MFSLKEKINFDWRFLVLASFAIVFFFVYSYLPLQAPEKFVSPDETANFVFIKNLIKDGIPRIYEPLNREVDNLIHPRSINVAGDYLVPGGFLGLILIYGLLGKTFGLGVVSFLTPLFAILAVLFFYYLIKKIFSAEVAFFSGLFLLIHPAWWYWSSQTLSNNVLFVSLVIIGLTILIVRKKKNELTFALGGLFFSLAVAVRTSEIVWLTFLLLTLALIFRKHLSWRKVFIFIFFFVLVILPIFYYNQLLYQSPFASGYSQLQENLSSPRFFISKVQIKHFFFPFEVVSDNFLKNFYNYFISLFFFYFILFVLGSLNFIFKLKRASSAQKIYFVFFVIISLYLVVYYGSWNFYDNLDPAKVTIGTSYVRYWLPIYIFSLPFVALIFLALLAIFKKRYLKLLIGGLAVLILFVYSANLVFPTEEGLLKIKENLWDYQEKFEIIQRLTESNAVIVADRNDKTVFPERRVVSCLIADCPKFESLPKLIAKVPVYYYPSSPNFKAEEFNQEILVKYNLEIDEGQVVKDRERIYQFKIKYQISNIKNAN
jgi:hypothetical protein